MKYFLLILGLVILYYYLFYQKRIKKKATFSEMVEDRICKRYVVKNKALKFEFNGEEYYFCSEECMKEFLERLKSKPRS